MSNTVSKKTTSALGTNTSNQAIAHLQPYVKQADLLVTSTASGGAKTVLVLGTDYTVSDNGAGRAKAYGTVTILNPVLFTSIITITHKYPTDMSGDIARMANDEGYPIDGELCADDRGVSSIQSAKKRSFTLKPPSTISNP